MVSKHKNGPVGLQAESTFAALTE